jgi:glycosyltransferase involved in cell wall biosynthesis
MDISVVIPLYNKERYILRAISSVINQNTPAAEIVDIDDGSTDNGANEVRQTNDKRVRLIQQKNAGEGAARNRGVEESSCNIVAFLDADDEWKPDFLTHIQRLINNFPDCGAYGTAYEIINPGGSITYPDFNEIPPPPWIGIIPNFFSVMQSGNIFCSSSVVIPKEIFIKLKGFPEGVIQGADRMLWVKLGINYPIAFSSSPQAIIHGEAINRASEPFVSESATANLIDSMLENGTIPYSLISEINDYNTYLKVQKVKHRIKAGRSKSARDLLREIKQNKKYKYSYWWLYFWSFIPNKLILFIRSMRLNFRRPK